jgi:hypothetical protein
MLSGAAAKHPENFCIAMFRRTVILNGNAMNIVTQERNVVE